ncbi:MAG TPA: winged-helix domain-containing protein [Aeromicrobium sp.]|nr:winged-helix domain-containing protein [Aeromicrobium sp.]
MDDAIDWVSATTREQYDVPVTTRPLGLTGDILHPVDNPGLQIKRPPIVGSGVGSLGGLAATARGYRGPIPEATVTRLAVYRRVLSAMTEQGAVTVSSAEFAAAAGVNSAKLRKDLSYIGPYGTRDVGYEVKPLIDQIERVLGWTVAGMASAPLGGLTATARGRTERATLKESSDWSDDLLVAIEIASRLPLPHLRSLQAATDAMFLSKVNELEEERHQLVERVSELEDHLAASRANTTQMRHALAEAETEGTDVKPSVLSKMSTALDSAYAHETGLHVEYATLSRRLASIVEQLSVAKRVRKEDVNG